MQEGNGETLLQAFRRSHPELPIVVMSADATVETVRRMRGLGASGFLAKPGTAVILRALVAQFLR